jgi:hypothetical protein
MSNAKLTKTTLPSFNEIDRLVQKGRNERALALRGALKSLTTGATETKPTLAGAAHA